MAQYLKDDVQEGIATAALKVFARKGYTGATVAEIAKAARLSTGNIYRYYENKSVLFDAVVSDDFVHTFTALLRKRVHSLDGVSDFREPGAAAAFHRASEELLQFCIDHRLRVIVLLGRAQGSRHEGFSEKLVQELIQLAVAHFRALRPHHRVTETTRFLLEQIYRSLVSNLVGTLTAFEEEASIREAVEGYSRYHLAGLKSLFE
jgi:AcrR family transcriptional regulator